MTVTVYSKPACTQCTVSKSTLKAKGVDFTEINMMQDPAALDLVAGLGYRQAPVVVVRDESGSIQDSWSGFNFEKIAALAAA